MKTKTNKQFKATRAAILAIVLNTVLTLLKFVLSSITGSLALKAEAFHSFSDIWSSVMVYISIRYSREHSESEKHGFFKGLWLHPQRMAALYIGIFLIIVSIVLFMSVFKERTFDVRFPVPAAIVVLVFALGSWLLSRFEKIVGEKTGSTALIADAYHSRVDMLGSVMVAIALLGESLGLKLDRIAAGILSIFIFAQAISVLATIWRDYTEKDLDRSDMVPPWVENFYRNLLPVWEKSFYTCIAKLFKLSPDDKDCKARVNLRISYSLLIIIIMAWIFSGFFILNPHQQAIVERFGKPLQIEKPLGPGLHYKFPWPIDRAKRVDCSRIKRVVIGSEVSSDSEMMLWTNMHYVREFNVLTGENIFADIGMAVQYRISNLFKYLYSSDKPDLIVTETCYSILLESFARKELLASITTERDRWEIELLDAIRTNLAEIDIGIEITDLNLRDIHPPMSIASEFEDVVSAEIDYETYINTAVGYSNNSLPRARGKATQTVTSAKAQRDAMVKMAEGEVQRFSFDYEEYEKAKAVYKIRVLMEVFETYLPGIEKFILPKEAANGNVDLWLFNTDSVGKDK